MASNSVYEASIFKQYFESNDPDLIAWRDNVLAKLVEKGIVANNVLRETKDGVVTDFEEFYSPIVLFFGYLIRLAREFEDFKDNEFLADQYLLGQGHFTCGDEGLEQLAYSITNLLRRRTNRNTVKMYEMVADVNLPDGELLALLCWDNLTYFKIGAPRPQFNGWNINNSSPMHRGCTGRYDLNSAYENTENVLDLSKYPIVNPSYVFLSRYRGKESIEIEAVPFGQEAGIGLFDITKEIIIDPRLNFEITFYVAQDATFENLTFGAKAIDANGDQTTLLSSVDGTDSNFFFETRRLNQAGRFYFVRGIIFNKDRELLSVDDAKLNIGFGKNLKFTENVVSIIPYIVMDNNAGNDSDFDSDNFDSQSTDFDSGDSGIDDSESWIDSSYDGEGSIFIWNLKVTPCDLKYNRCYLNNKNFIDVIVDNKNGRYTTVQIDDIMRRYFIPYNTAFKTTHISDLGNINPDASFLLLEEGTGYILLEDENKIVLE